MQSEVGNMWFVYGDHDDGKLLCPPVGLAIVERIGDKVKLTLTSEAITLYNSSGWKDIRKNLWAVNEGTDGVLKIYYDGFVDVYPGVSIDAVSGKQEQDDFSVHKIYFVYTRRERYKVDTDGIRDACRCNYASGGVLCQKELKH